MAKREDRGMKGDERDIHRRGKMKPETEQRYRPRNEQGKRESELIRCLSKT